MSSDLSRHFRHTLHMNWARGIKEGSTGLLPGSFYCQNLVKKSHFWGTKMAHQRFSPPPPPRSRHCVYLAMSGPVWIKQGFFSEWKTRLWSVWKGNNVSGLTSKFGWSCNIDRMVQLHSSAPQKATFLLFNAYGSVWVQDQMGWGTNLHIRVRCVFADVQRQRGLKWYARSQAIWSSGTLSHTLGKSTETRRVFSQLLLRLDQWIWLTSPPRRCRNKKYSQLPRAGSQSQGQCLLQM